MWFSKIIRRTEEGKPPEQTIVPARLCQCGLIQQYTVKHPEIISRTNNSAIPSLNRSVDVR